MGNNMQTDTKLKETIEIAKGLVEGLFTESSKDHGRIKQQLSDILSSVRRYSYKVSEERSVQMEQVENNIDDLKHLFGYAGDQKHLSAAINHLDNLIHYTGANTSV